MKKNVTLLLMSLLCPLCIIAADVTPGIVVSKTDGSSASIAISSVQSIKFGADAMLVNMKDNSQRSFAVDDITGIIFENIASAIKALNSDDAVRGMVRITDVSGRTIFYGKACNAPSHGKLPAGIYVVTGNDKSYKVMVE